MQQKVSITQALVFLALIGFAIMCVVMTGNGTLPGFLQ